MESILSPKYLKKEGCVLKTFVIVGVGAGSGLGLALAKTFGKQGYRIAMISKTQEKLNQYADKLNNLGIEA